MWFSYCRFFLGNPGDYAWEREGLDAIVTQLLNQMDGTGPPPLAKDKIKEIPVVVITQDQVGELVYLLVPWLRISPSSTFRGGAETTYFIGPIQPHPPAVNAWSSRMFLC